MLIFHPITPIPIQPTVQTFYAPAGEQQAGRPA